jgi:Gas vesicle synthesis protein GvpL/GvpF
MSYLVYCVFSSRQPESLSPPLGVGGDPVVILCNSDLGAAVSAGSGFQTPNVSRLLAYERVVEYIHGQRSLIPMRYGCVFDERPQIIGFLQERKDEYQSLLDKLDGTVEMGIRILLQDSETGKNRPLTAVARTGKGNCPGTAYLMSRKEYYAAQDGHKDKLHCMAQTLCQRLSGYFVGNREECWALSEHTTLLSLQFLMQRVSVAPFAGVVRSIAEELQWKLLLSGPWPPYNFVDCSRPR